MGQHTLAGTTPLIAGGAALDGNRGGGGVVASTIALQSRNSWDCLVSKTERVRHSSTIEATLPKGELICSAVSVPGRYKKVKLRFFRLAASRTFEKEQDSLRASWPV